MSHPEDQEDAGLDEEEFPVDTPFTFNADEMRVDLDDDDRGSWLSHIQGPRPPRELEDADDVPRNPLSSGNAPNTGEPSANIKPPRYYSAFMNWLGPSAHTRFRKLIRVFALAVTCFFIFNLLCILGGILWVLYWKTALIKINSISVKGLDSLGALVDVDLTFAGGLFMMFYDLHLVGSTMIDLRASLAKEKSGLEALDPVYSPMARLSLPAISIGRHLRSQRINMQIRLDIRSELPNLIQTLSQTYSTGSLANLMLSVQVYPSHLQISTNSFWIPLQVSTYSSWIPFRSLITDRARKSFKIADLLKPPVVEPDKSKGVAFKRASKSKSAKNPSNGWRDFIDIKTLQFEDLGDLSREAVKVIMEVVPTAKYSPPWLHLDVPSIAFAVGQLMARDSFMYFELSELAMTDGKSKAPITASIILLNDSRKTLWWLLKYIWYPPKNAPPTFGGMSLCLLTPIVRPTRAGNFMDLETHRDPLITISLDRLYADLARGGPALQEEAPNTLPNLYVKIGNNAISDLKFFGISKGTDASSFSISLQIDLQSCGNPERGLDYACIKGTFPPIISMISMKGTPLIKIDVKHALPKLDPITGAIENPTPAHTLPINVCITMLNLPQLASACFEPSANQSISIKEPEVDASLLSKLVNVFLLKVDSGSKVATPSLKSIMQMVANLAIHLKSRREENLDRLMGCLSLSLPKEALYYSEETTMIQASDGKKASPSSQAADKMFTNFMTGDVLFYLVCDCVSIRFMVPQFKVGFDILGVPIDSKTQFFSRQFYVFFQIIVTKPSSGDAGNLIRSEKVRELFHSLWATKMHHDLDATSPEADALCKKVTKEFKNMAALVSAQMAPKICTVVQLFKPYNHLYASWAASEQHTRSIRYKFFASRPSLLVNPTVDKFSLEKILPSLGMIWDQFKRYQEGSLTPGKPGPLVEPNASIFELILDGKSQAVGLPMPDTIIKVPCIFPRNRHPSSNRRVHPSDRLMLARGRLSLYKTIDALDGAVGKGLAKMFGALNLSHMPSSFNFFIHVDWFGLALTVNGCQFLNLITEPINSVRSGPIVYSEAFMKLRSKLQDGGAGVTNDTNPATIYMDILFSEKIRELDRIFPNFALGALFIPNFTGNEPPLYTHNGFMQQVVNVPLNMVLSNELMPSEDTNFLSSLLAGFLKAIPSGIMLNNFADYHSNMKLVIKRVNSDSFVIGMQNINLYSWMPGISIVIPGRLAIGYRCFGYDLARITFEGDKSFAFHPGPNVMNLDFELSRSAFGALNGVDPAEAKVLFQKMILGLAQMQSFQAELFMTLDTRALFTMPLYFEGAQTTLVKIPVPITTFGVPAR